MSTSFALITQSSSTRASCTAMTKLTVAYGEVEFKNPIVAVAGPLGRTFEALKRTVDQTDVDAGARLQLVARDGLRGCLSETFGFGVDGVQVQAVVAGDER